MQNKPPKDKKPKHNQNSKPIKVIVAVLWGHSWELQPQSGKVGAEQRSVKNIVRPLGTVSCANPQESVLAAWAAVSALTCTKRQPADRTEVTKAKNINSFKNRLRSNSRDKGAWESTACGYGCRGGGMEQWGEGNYPYLLEPTAGKATWPPDCSSMSPRAARRTPGTCSDSL